MIKYFQKKIKDKILKELKFFKIGSWIYVTEPTQEEIEQLSEKFELDKGLLTDALDPYEVPRLEVDEGNIYIYTRVPYTSNNSVTTIPLLIILSKNFFLTISINTLPFLEKFIENNNIFYTTQKVKLLLQLFGPILNEYNTFITKGSKEILKMRKSLEAISNEDIMKFVEIEETFNEFLNALVPTNAILDKLLSAKIIQLYEEDEDLVEDLALSIGQLIELCKSKIKLITNLRDAYTTVMTNNLNKVFRSLTFLAIFMTVPTMLSGLYGMNVALPLQHDPYAFWWVIVWALIITVFLYAFFRLKKWL